MSLPDKVRLGKETSGGVVIAYQEVRTATGFIQARCSNHLRGVGSKTASLIRSVAHKVHGGETPRGQAAQITDQHLKAVYLRIAHQWSVLARSYEFADSAEQFLLDAKRTNDANARQRGEESVPLPSSLASREAEHLLKPHSDRCCATLRLVPKESPVEPGAVAA